MGENTISMVTNVFLTFIVVSFFWSLGYVLIQKKADKLISKRRWIEQLPSLISTLGVLGTFVGITLGLINFNTANLDESIPLLLDGLKTAFFTSLAGMVGSIILSKVVSSAFDKKERGVSDINIAAGQICKAVKEMSKANKEALNEFKEQAKQQAKEQTAFYNTISDAFDVIKESMSELKGFGDKSSNVESALNSVILYTQNREEGNIEMKEKMGSIVVSLANIEEDSSVQAGKLNAIDNKTEIIVSTISFLNNNVAEILDLNSGIGTTQEGIADGINNLVEALHAGIDEIELKMKETNGLLVNKFDEFSELLKKSNTEALVEVMKTVTEEFQKQMNSLINKLIQENFDQLNKSVEALNVWQQENKEMISSLTKQYKDMASHFENTSVTLTNVGNDTKQLVSNGGKLKQLIDSLNQVIVEDGKFIEIVTSLESTVALTKDNMQMFDESTKALNTWVRKQRNFVDGVQLLIEKLDELNKIRDYNELFWKQTKNSLEEGAGIIARGSQTLNSQLTELDKQFYARLSTTLAELDACIQSMIKSSKR